MMIFALIYWFMQIVVSGTLVYALRESGDDFNKENLGIILLCTVFAPLTLIGLGGFLVHDKLQCRARQKVMIILNNWERLARQVAGVDDFTWWSPQGLENKYQCMRETVCKLKSKDLELLSKVSKNVHEIEKPIRDAILNELVDRKLLK